MIRQRTQRACVRLKAAFGLILALSVLTLSGAAFADVPAENASAAGLAAYYAGHYDQAITLLQKALATEPDSLTLRYCLADALSKQKRTAEARAEYRQMAALPDASPEFGIKHAFPHETAPIENILPGNLDWEISSRIKDPSPQVIQAGLGDQIRLKSNPKEVTFDQLEKVKSELAKLPPMLLQRFIDGGGEVIVVGSVLSIQSEKPKDAFDADGLTTDDGKSVYVTIKGIDPPPSRRLTSASVTIHEMGHAIDMIAGSKTPQYYAYSASPAFLAVFKAHEVRAYLKSLRPDDYFGSNPQEAFAEMFSRYFESEATRETLPPSVRDYYHTQIEAKYEPETASK